jgi:hypothetical protein
MYGIRPEEAFDAACTICDRERVAEDLEHALVSTGSSPLIPGAKRTCKVDESSVPSVLCTAQALDVQPAAMTQVFEAAESNRK